MFTGVEKLQVHSTNVRVLLLSFPEWTNLLVKIFTLSPVSGILSTKNLKSNFENQIKCARAHT